VTTTKRWAERIMVALDYPDAETAGVLIRKLEGIPCYLKVGMQLYYVAGPEFVRSLKDSGYKVFLDLKMHDIPNTVKGGAQSITRLGVDMFNVHAAGGKLMMEAALEGVEQALAPGQRRPLVIAVTQLTSTSEEMLNKEIGIPGSMLDAVVRYARLTREAGLDGVVASPRETPWIKRVCGQSFVAVTPGIRPAGAEQADQKRVMTPGEAFRQGADYLVIGRPITASPDPKAALETIIEELIDHE